MLLKILLILRFNCNNYNNYNKIINEHKYSRVLHNTKMRTIHLRLLRKSIVFLKYHKSRINKLKPLKYSLKYYYIPKNSIKMLKNSFCI